MAESLNWPLLLADRLLSTPAVNWLLPEPFHLSHGGQRIALGRRHLELFALAGRSAKRGKSLVLFLPPREPADLLALAVYFHFVRLAVQAGVSTAGAWINAERIGQARDVLISGSSAGFRSWLLEDVRLYGEPLARRLQIVWPNPRRRGAKNKVLERRGEQKNPAICLLGQRASRLELLEEIAGEVRPFVALVEAAETPDVALQAVANLVQTFPGMPIIVLAALGHKATLLEARKRALPVWVARAGDIAALDAAEDAAGAVAGGPGSPTRLAQAANRLRDGITVRLAVVADATMGSHLRAMIEATMTIEREDGASSELLRQSRALVRELAGLAVPLTAHEEAVSASRRAGPYATTSLLRRVEAVRSAAGASGRAESARQDLIAETDALVTKLNKRSAHSGKFAALVNIVRAAQAKAESLVIVCPNEATEAAVQGALGQAGIDLLREDQPVRVMTRSRAWRSLDSAASQGAVLLLGGPDFASGIFFAGLAREVIVLTYDFEEEAVRAQLEHIAYDTQRLSAPGIDKWRVISGSPGPVIDREVDFLVPARWHIKIDPQSVTGTYLDEPVPPGPLLSIDPDWLTACLEAADEAQPAEEPATSVPLATVRIRIALDDGEDDLVVAPDTRVLVVDELERTGEGEIEATELKPGMTIIAMRHDPGRSLFECLAERLETNRDYMLAQSVLVQWRHAVAVIAERAGGSASVAYEMLRRHDVGVGTSQAVANWMKGAVIGPAEARSVLAVAKVAGRVDLERNYRVIHEAAKRIATWRRSLGRNLAQHVRAGLGLGPDRLIDKDLGLYSSDLEELTRVASVVSVESVRSASR